MGYGITHTAPLPEVGVTPRSTWAELLVDALDELRTTLDAKVTPAGIDVNANLSFRSGADYYAATNLAYVGLHLQTALAAGDYPGVIYKKGANGDLYYNNDAGDAVQITSGSAVPNGDGSVNGTGYNNDGVEISWVAADVAYEMRSGVGTDDLADIKVDDVYLNGGSGNFLRLAAPSMSSDYTTTFPAAPPASTSVVQMSNTGVLSASASADIATTGAVLTGTLSVSASALIATTLGVSGLVTAEAGLTASADQNVNLSGTGRVTHGTRYAIVNATDFQSAVPSRSHLRTNGRLIHDSASSTDYYCSLPVFVGINNTVTIRNIEFHAIHTTGTSTREYSFSYSVLASTTMTAVETSTDTTSNDTIAVNVTTDHTLLTARRYYLRWKATEQNDTLLGVVITYDVA